MNSRNNAALSSCMSFVRPLVFATLAAVTTLVVLLLSLQATSAHAAEPMYVPAVVNTGDITDLEARLLTGLNAERMQAGLEPLTYDTTATLIARTRSQQMADQGYFAHQDPNTGLTPYVELLSQNNVDFYVAGENLALNNYGEWESPERALISLMKSPTHRANILANDFSSIGIGEVTDANGRHIYTMIFIG